MYSDRYLDINKYLAVCEQLGQEPDPEKMPPEYSDFPLEVQQAFLLHSYLHDQWDGMSGMYMGKDLSAMGTLLDILEIEDKKTVVFFLKCIEDRYANQINKKVSERQKASKSKIGK